MPRQGARWEGRLRPARLRLLTWGVRAQYVPSIVVALLALLAGLRVLQSMLPAYAVAGLYTAWVYLRFYQVCGGVSESARE